jgi:hypothetical protein
MSERSDIIVRPDSSDPASLVGRLEKPEPNMSAPAKPRIYQEKMKPFLQKGFKIGGADTSWGKQGWRASRRPLPWLPGVA